MNKTGWSKAFVYLLFLRTQATRAGGSLITCFSLQRDAGITLMMKLGIVELDCNKVFGGVSSFVTEK